MLRALVRTPRRRLAWLVLAVALAWTAWALWPPAPEARWSLPQEGGTRAWFMSDGRTVLTGRLQERVAPNGQPLEQAPGPLIGRDAETGRERYRLFESVRAMGLIQMTPDGRRLTLRANAKGGAITDLLVADPADGHQLAALADVNFDVEDFKGVPRPRFLEQINPVSPDGRWVAYRQLIGDDLRLYDLEAGREGPILKGARPPAAFSPDGRTLAAQTADYRVGFWDVATGAAHPTPGDRGPEVLVVGLRFAPDGRTLAAVHLMDAPFGKPPTPRSWPPGAARMAVALWDATTGTRRPDLPLPGPYYHVFGLSFSPDSRFLAVQSTDPGWLWDLTADPPAVAQLSPAGLTVHWSNLPVLLPGGLALAAAGPRELALFDPVTRERRQTFRLWHEPAYGVWFRFSPDGRTLLVGYSAETWLNRLPEGVRRWLTRNRVDPIPGPNAIGTFDVATGRPLRSIQSTVGPSVRVMMDRMHPFMPDGRSFRSVAVPDPGRYVTGSSPVWFERWSVEPPGWPWGMMALTAAAVGLAVVDRARSRRRGA
jgi:hypothetical protein